MTGLKGFGTGPWVLDRVISATRLSSEAIDYGDLNGMGMGYT